ncbi:MAG: DUF3293 domain-containing protein [Xanthomonadales bacterium]|nr:DUF3293 domain-containing protein [Xanthomonadales bacterium]MCC6561897.1 DUF3293 domain-containing protein [Xanthomonadales bacterium]
MERDLLDQFLCAEYGCESGTPALIHIGERCASAGSRHWITAYNPLGAICPDASNLAAQRLLLGAVAAAGWHGEAGFARAPATAPGQPRPWQEPCIVLHSVPDALVDQLAHRFRQLATVALHPGQPARLRCYRALWRERFHCADMDAANVEWVA